MDYQSNSSNMNKYIYIAVAVVALLIGGVMGYTAFHPQTTTPVVKGVGEPSEFDNISLTGGQRTGVIHGDTTIPQSQVEGFGLATLVTSGSIPAQGQYVIITNPFAATSTVSYAKIQGTAGTSTVDLLVGTTTQTSAITNNSQISPTLVNDTLVATSTQFYSMAGVPVGPGGGYKAPGAGTFYSIVVGPSESIGILATSSYAASSATGNSGLTNPTETFNLTYTIEWQK